MEQRAYDRGINEPRESFKGLLNQLATSSADIVRNEIALVIQGFREKVNALSTGAILFVTAVITAFVGIAALCAAIVIGLSFVMNSALAAVVAGAGFFIIGAIFGLAGYREIKKSAPGSSTVQSEKKRFLKEVRR